MWKLKIALIVIGSFIAMTNWDDFKFSNAATQEPVAVDLQHLEQSKLADLENPHIKIGGHLALFSKAVYKYQGRKGSKTEPTDDTRVTAVYYPIISRQHPDLQKLSDFLGDYGDAQKIPQYKAPRFNDVSVIVKSKKFTTVEKIPSDWQDQQSLQGMVVNRYHDLEYEDKKVMEEHFYGANYRPNFYLIEEGKEPSPTKNAIGFMAAGAALCLAGAAGFLPPRKKKRVQS